MKTKKIILGISIFVIVVLGFVAYKAWGSLDKIIEAAIESYGPEIIGAKIELDSVNLNLGEGQATLNGLYIGNPDGFNTDYAMQLAQVKLSLDIESLTSDVVVIKEVLIQSPQIIYEVTNGGSNIDRLAENAKSYVGTETPVEEEDDSDSGEAKLIIDNIYINEGQVSVSHSILKGKALSVGLPNLHLQDIGKEENGATPGKIAQEIMAEIKSGVGTAVTSLGLGETFSSGAAAIKKGAGSVMDSAKGAGEKLKGMFD
jgi:hypothetical protein